MTVLWLLFGVTCALHAASGSVCTQRVSKVVSEPYTSYYSCGWWNWSRCSRRSLKYKAVTDDKSSCCAGSYGHVVDGCPGVCPYTSAKKSSSCSGNRICRDYQCDNSGLDNSSLPTRETLTFNENDNTERLLWTVKATCFVQYTCTCGGSTCKCSKTVPCTNCTVTGTDGIAEVRNGVDIYRKKCSEPTCRDCSKHRGCLDHAVTYNIAVQCRASGYTDNGVVRQTLALTVEAAPEAEIELPKGTGADEPMELDTNAQVGDVLLTIGDITVPPSETNVTYSLKGPVSNITGKSLFEYDHTSKQIKVHSDLSQEPGGVYTLQFCVGLRRKEDCVDMVVEIDRITTTSTTTTTTTTTTQRPTTEPDDEYTICDAQVSWKVVPFMDWWCNLVCGPDPVNCPYIHTHCRCTVISNERLRCRAGGIYSSSEQWKKHMDGWCDLNCNYDEHSNCPTNTSNIGYCVCDPPSK